MKILFLTHYYAPHIGGVEKHAAEVAKALIKKGHKVTVLTEKHDPSLKSWEIIDTVKVVRFSYPHIKVVGLLAIWLSIWKNRKLVTDADIVHIHDVFIWYLPFRFLYPKKAVYTTFHGWEGIWPIPKFNIFLKQLAAKYSTGTIAIGKYIEKYYGIKSDRVMYGGKDTLVHHTGVTKTKNSVVFVGRLEKDTGILKFLKRLDDFRFRNVQFVGDGRLWKQCEKYGKIHGFCDPKPFLQSAEYVVPGGYLSYIEAVSNNCKIIVYPDNPLKKDYWKEIMEIKTFPSWAQIADDYLTLYHSSE
jgi:glycosyltransferase involved in cell wall biosynthesis